MARFTAWATCLSALLLGCHTPAALAQAAETASPAATRRAGRTYDDTAVGRAAAAYGANPDSAERFVKTAGWVDYQQQTGRTAWWAYEMVWAAEEAAEIVDAARTAMFKKADRERRERYKDSAVSERNSRGDRRRTLDTPGKDRRVGEDAGAANEDEGAGPPAVQWPTPPWSPDWNNSIAICIAIKDENHLDIREWVRYHRWLGVDHIFLTENHSETSIREHLADFIEDGFLTYATIEEDHQQAAVYKACDRNYRDKYNWLMYMDADELIHITDRNETLKEVLDDFKGYPGLSAHWVLFGPNYHSRRPEGGGVLRHYTKCFGQAHELVKTFVNNFYVQEIMSVHNQRYRSETSSVNAAHWPLMNRLDPDHVDPPPACTPSPDPTAPEATLCPPTVPYEYVGTTTNSIRETERRTTRRVVINHYVTRSIEDFMAKLRRGAGNRMNIHQWHYFEWTAEMANLQLPICSSLSEIADECCPDESKPETQPGASDLNK